ncbi:MAG: tetratricopeptide repeat protein [Lachnospiraceae bacterium]|nr:tetratricopeptide repeat protein [Lachnospiraceae bacterium]
MKLKKKTVCCLVPALVCLCLAGCGGKVAQENKEAYKTIGIRALEAGNYEDAVEAFDNALAQANGKVTMDEVDICYYKARALFEDGKKEEALEVYNALLDLDKNLKDAYFLRGTVELSLGMGEEALADYKEAVRRDSRNIELYVAMYDNLNEAGRTAEAREFLQEATEIPGQKATDYTLRGRAFMILGNTEGAREELNRAAEKDDPEAFLYLGELAGLEGNRDSAREYYSRYLSYHEEDAGALNVLGCLAMENEDYEQALGYFEQALLCCESSMVDPKEILRNRILTLEYLGRFEEAKEAMEEYESAYELDEELLREATFLETR